MSFSWFGNYSTWTRTRRLHQSPYLARADTNTSRAATAMAQNAANNNNTNGTGAVVINMGNVGTADARARDKDKKAHDSLFGPNIGVVNNGPTWTEINEKKMLADELTPEVVQSWIEKSKESTHPTTTLQALVNLKRPTLRLSPLSVSDPDVQDSLSTQHHHHGLEFEYDCDAPKCGIYVHVLLPPDHPDATNPVSTATGLSKLLVFEAIIDGGFGKVLKLEEGAMLELGRFEYVPGKSKNTRPISSVSGTGTGAPTTSISTPSDSAAAATPTPGTAATEVTPATTTSSGRSTVDRRRRFTHFSFRKRLVNHSVSGPALAVVDAEPPSAGVHDNAPTHGHGKKDGEDADAEGVRVIIRLVALDEQATELASPNEQVTYLHIVRFGAKATDAGGEEGEAQDSRPWVVKVVKREATIGPHTFHLHEIYGLSSSSSTAASTSHPEGLSTSPVSLSSHTYPPATTPSMAQPVTEDEPSSECLVCLSSPREVVLLPCRHLVACKECALNMVEYGAGGNITHTEPAASTSAGENAGAGASANVGEETAEGVGTGTGAEGAPSGSGAATGTAASTTTPTTTPAVATPSATTNPRRKRKTKGWNCPVCRQPYTSLLRITTVPPPSPDTKEAEEGQTAEPERRNAAGTSVGSGGGDTSGSGNGTGAGGSGRAGLLGGAFRPTFLRSFSRGAGVTGDLESQGTERV